MEQNAKLRKWLQPEDYQRSVEQCQRVKEEDIAERKKLVERRKKISEIYGEEHEGDFYDAIILYIC